MRRWKLCTALTLTCLAVWACASIARAMVIMPQPGPQRVINSDVVIVGKVVALEPQDVMVDKVNYRIAVVKVDQARCQPLLQEGGESADVDPAGLALLPDLLQGRLELIESAAQTGQQPRAFDR